MRKLLSGSRRILLISVYLIVVVVQIFLWPECEDGSFYVDDEELDLPPLPVNPLNAPMWNSKYPYHHCGTWQKPYTHMHREVVHCLSFVTPQFEHESEVACTQYRGLPVHLLMIFTYATSAAINGSFPSSYLVYTTGVGFPPIIEGVPDAMKGIATVFLMAVLTDRVFILDWKSPPGFSNILTHRYIDWTGGATFRGVQRTDRVHDIGSRQWFAQQNHSVSWYMTTDFDEYFTNEVEVIQAHSYDFTYALLRNRHYRHKILQFGLHRMHCRVCCVWQYLFKYSPSFVRVMNSLTKSKLKLTPSTDLIFININLASENLHVRVALELADKTMACAQKLNTGLRAPIWVLTANSLKLLEVLQEKYPMIKSHGLFYNRERYMVDLQRQNSSKSHHLKVPRTEQNALLHFFMGFFLQLNSTVLFSSPQSPYSEIMSSLRQFYHTSSRYVVYPDQGCRLQHFRIS